MNSIDDTIQEISFSHDFDPISIKCELDIPVDILIPTSSSTLENKIADNPILDLNSDDMLEEIKIKVEPSLFGDESCGEFWPVDVELSSDMKDDEVSPDLQQSKEVDMEDDDVIKILEIEEKEITNLLASELKETDVKEMQSTVETELKEISTSIGQMDQTPSCSNNKSTSSVSTSTSNCPMKLRRKKSTPPINTTVSIPSKLSRKIKKPRKHKIQLRYIESSESEKEDEEKCFTCKYCAMQFRSKSNYELHLKPNTDHGNLNLPCLYCSINFTDISMLEKHIKNIHKVCKLCDIPFLTDKEYDNHEKLHKSGLITFYICTCGTEFRDKQLFLNHVFKIHNNKNNFKHPLTRIIKEISYENMVCKKSILCPYCHINFSDENILLNHKRIRHNVRQCNVCYVHYIDKIGEPETVEIECKNCQSKQLTKECLVQTKSCENTTKQSEIIQQSSSSCENSTDSESELENDKIITNTNILQSSNYSINKCKYCYRKFSGKNELQDHLKLPDVDNLKLPCLYCNNIYINAKKLEKHLKNIHYACKVCDIKFNNKKEIKLHQNDHKLGLIIFFICICGDEFKDFLTFHTHVKFIHKNDKEYINPTKNSIIECTYEYAACISKKICPYCNKTFSTDLELCNHKKDVHNVYKCEKCDEHFIYMSEDKDDIIIDVSHCRKCILAESDEETSNDSSSDQNWMEKMGSDSDSEDL